MQVLGNTWANGVANDPPILMLLMEHASDCLNNWPDCQDFILNSPNAHEAKASLARCMAGMFLTVSRACVALRPAWPAAKPGCSHSSRRKLSRSTGKCRERQAPFLPFRSLAARRP